MRISSSFLTIVSQLFVHRTFYQAAEKLSLPDSITKHYVEARQNPSYTMFTPIVTNFYNAKYVHF